MKHLVLRKSPSRLSWVSCVVPLSLAFLISAMAQGAESLSKEVKTPSASEMFACWKALSPLPSDEASQPMVIRSKEKAVNGFGKEEEKILILDGKTIYESHPYSDKGKKIRKAGVPGSGKKVRQTLVDLGDGRLVAYELSFGSLTGKKFDIYWPDPVDPHSVSGPHIKVKARAAHGPETEAEFAGSLGHRIVEAQRALAEEVVKMKAEARPKRFDQAISDMQGQLSKIGSACASTVAKVKAATVRWRDGSRVSGDESMKVLSMEKSWALLSSYLEDTKRGQLPPGDLVHIQNGGGPVKQSEVATQ